MPRKRVKRTVKKVEPSNADAEKPQVEDEEVERQSAAIRAIRDVGIEQLLTRLRLFRSYFSEEQLKTPALKFFQENFPNVSVIPNAENGEFELKWNGEEDDRRDLHGSLLHRFSISYPDCSAIPPLGGYELSSGTVKTSFFGAENLQIRDFLLEGPSDSQMLGLQDGLQTPGVTSQRLSIGMTPKTLRLPKAGEMLLSVRGSPLGVYKEDNMEAIHESEEG